MYSHCLALVGGIREVTELPGGEGKQFSLRFNVSKEMGRMFGLL
jgi:hypothetical protein